MIRAQQWQLILMLFALVALGGATLLQSQFAFDQFAMTHTTLGTSVEGAWFFRGSAVLLVLGVVLTLFLLWPAFGLIESKQVKSQPWCWVFVGALIALTVSLPLGAIAFGGIGMGLILKHYHEEAQGIAPRSREWDQALGLLALVGVASFYLSQQLLVTWITEPSSHENREFFTEPWFAMLLDLVTRLSALSIALSEGGRLLQRSRESASRGIRGVVTLMILCGLLGFWFENYIAVGALSLLVYIIVLLRQGHERWEGFKQEEEGGGKKKRGRRSTASLGA